MLFTSERFLKPELIGRKFCALGDKGNAQIIIRQKIFMKYLYSVDQNVSFFSEYNNNTKN